MTALSTLTPMLRVLHLFVTLAMIGVVLIQRSEGGGLGIGTTQGMGAFMSGRGTANLLTRTTAILGTLFFAISLGLALLNKGTSGVGHDILAVPPAAPGINAPKIRAQRPRNRIPCRPAPPTQPPRFRRSEPAGFGQHPCGYVAIVGAGVAGLSAAARLQATGRSIAVLEAGPHIGGRAFTELLATPGGLVAIDHGASWLHDAERNPLIPLARAHGLPVHPDTPWENRVRLIDPPGQIASIAAYEAAEARWTKAVTARLSGPDTTLAEAAADVADDPRTATIESWEGAIIAAADAAVLSLQDWHDNALAGSNAVAPGGLGAMLARLLGQAPVHLGAVVTGIDQRADGVRLETSAGSLRAAAAIVTVSTGVLRAGAIRFSPGLPQGILAALNGLPMGLLSKIILPAAGENRLGLPYGANLFRRIPARGAPALSTLLWPDNAPLAIGFTGGQAAWDLAAHPDDAAAWMRDELTLMLGATARAAFAPTSRMTDWGTNPHFHGAYAYATPGHTPARKTLATPLWNNRLLLAGEATAPDGLAGTVAGAWLSGYRAAGMVVG